MPKSGKNGKVYVNGVEVVDITNWNINKTADVKSYRSSSTNGNTRRKSGGKDSTGDFECMPNSGGDLPFEEGDIVSLELYEDGTLKHSGDAMIESIGTGVNPETGDIIKYRVNWGADGEWTKPDPSS